MTFRSPLFLLALLILLPLTIWPVLARRGSGLPRQVRWQLLVRGSLFTLLTLGLARLEIPYTAAKLAVVFLVDLSDSMPSTAQAQAADWVRQAVPAMEADDQAAVVVFGADALVEQPMRALREVGAFRSLPVRVATDFGAALRLGLALFPANTARRLVLLSDGIETTGDGLAAARLAAANGVQLQVVPFAFTRDSELLLSNVHAPSRLRQGTAFDLTVGIYSTVAQTVNLRILAGDEVIHVGDYTLNKGDNNLLIPLKAGSPGFTRYRVQIAAPVDSFRPNNELATFSEVQGPPHVLVVAASNADTANPAQQLVQALQQSNWQVTQVGPSGVPFDLSSLAAYASVVLVDVPARLLQERQQLALQQYVRDLGGGLVVVGGGQSYGVGGYYKTPLAAALPVDMQLKDQKRRPRLSMVFIIDHSGSMEETSGGVSKLEIAKEATMRSIEMLSPGDNVGVLIFDDTAKWVVPLAEMTDSQAVINQVATVRSGGGTNIYAGLKAMANVLPTSEGNIKHVILLTDGGADPAGISELVKGLNQNDGITISTVGVGRDAAPFLPDIAVDGGGRYHFAADPASIPQIFTEELTLASRAYIIEETFFPKQVGNSPILQGLTAVPQLYGYIGTSAKATANTILVSQLADGNQDPILASWQYGLGKSVAWTADATGRWGKQWVRWQDFGKFWRQAVEYTITNTLESDLTMQVQLDGGRAILQVDAVDLNGDYQNNLNLQANVVSPSGSTDNIVMVQTAPGRYSANFTPQEPGAYLLRVVESGGQNFAGQTGGWVFGYSPEYRVLQANPNALIQLAAITGGGLAAAEPAAVFKHDLPVTRATNPVWQLLLLLAALLLPLDIALRRLQLNANDWRKLWVRLWPDRVAVAAQPVSPTLTRLQQAKSRATVQNKPNADTRLEDGSTSQPPAVDPPPSATILPKSGSTTVPPVAGESLATRLMQKKREREQD